MKCLKCKLNITNNFSDIFLIKCGKIIKCHKCNTCYKTNRSLSLLFNFYYGGGIFLVLLFFIFHYLDKLLFNTTISIIISITIYIVIEYLSFYFLPLKEYKCEKDNKNELKS